MSDTLEKNSDSLAEILEENNETQEIENQETVQENNIENDDTEVDAENAPTEESEDPEEELKFIRLTSGWTKEEKELVKKIKDPELRQEAVEATKKRRVDFDRRSLELGNTRKELAEMRTKLEELTSKQNNPVAEDEDEYLTEQELKQKKQLENVERQLQELKEQEAVSQAQTVQKELTSFAQSQNEDGSLKHPYFERVRKNMSLLFQADQNGTMTLEKAYNKAVLLDDELEGEQRQELLLKEKIKQKEALEKVKKNKKYSPSVGSGNKNLSAKELNYKAISELFA
tara:strand:- start:319 stop:1176 length:858 start_codon:yes stop_codon:yes gene_type:complete